VKEINVEVHTSNKTSGRLILERTDVNWFLSIDEADLPRETKKENKRLSAL
jgi:hypothetical protein